jgi:hypothetical protein
MERQDDRFRHETLLRGQDGITDGVWLRLKGDHPVTITIEGTFVADVDVMVSNDPRPVLNSFNGGPIVDDVTHTVPAVVKVDAAYEWIKVRVTAYTSGAVSAFLKSGPGPRTL